jgi:hypothetical protein
MATVSYVIKQGDRFSPFTGKPISYPVGTVIYGDRSSQSDYGTSNPSPSNQNSPNISSRNVTGTYKGQNIYAGTDAEVARQMQVIDSSSAGQNNGNTSNNTNTSKVVIGTYRGKDIYAGTDEEIRNQMQAIDSYPVSPVDANDGSSTGDETPIDDSDIPLDSSIYDYDDKVFSNLVPVLKPGTPEYQAAMDALDTSYFDILQQQMNAKTEQEQQVADYNWQTLKKSIETNLKTTLSDDVFQAWDQIQGLKSQYGEQNIQGSGLQQEAIDSYLNKVRRTDSVARDESQTKQETAQQNYYMNYATPAQVNELVKSNPGLAQRWGLIPSSDVKNSMSFATLKAKYPNLSDDEINKYIANILDENGNYRSALYQKYMTGNTIGTQTGTADVTTDQYGSPISETMEPGDTGMADINAAKEQWKRDTIDNENIRRAADAARALGTTAATTGAQSGTPSGTQFNKTPSSQTSSQTSTETKTTSPTITPATPAKTSEPSTGPLVNPPGAKYDRNTGKELPSGTNDIRDSNGLLVNPIGAIYDRNTGKKIIK